MTVMTGVRREFPRWLPRNARLYLRHTEDGVSIRALARTEGMHASTVLRKVRAFENRRDDPLVDEVLTRIGRLRAAMCPPLTERSEMNSANRGDGDMTAALRVPADVTDDATLFHELQRILRRMAEPGACLVVALQLEKAAVMKGTLRIAVTDRGVAQALAVKSWIALKHQGKITTYEITAAGRAAARRSRASEEPDSDGSDDPQNSWDDGARASAGRGGSRNDAGAESSDRARRGRYSLAESPLSALARRRDKDGVPFLAQDQVAAGERLREDFELAQMGPRVTQNWDSFLTSGTSAGMPPQTGGQGGSAAARDRVARALRDLGPGLGDMVLRTCCFLEGLEEAESRLGWSARSGKIVLRIALMRLARHYLETYGRYAPLIG